jgi:hypothetical protein
MLTLNKILEASPCDLRWESLFKRLGKTKAYDEHLKLEQVLDDCGMYGTLLVLDKVLHEKRLLRLFEIGCRQQIWPHLKDQRSRNAVKVAHQFANGEATEEELHDAWVAFDAAVDPTGEDAWNAAWAGTQEKQTALLRTICQHVDECKAFDLPPFDYEKP